MARTSYSKNKPLSAARPRSFHAAAVQHNFRAPNLNRPTASNNNSQQQQAANKRRARKKIHRNKHARPTATTTTAAGSKAAQHKRNFQLELPVLHRMQAEAPMVPPWLLDVDVKDVNHTTTTSSNSSPRSPSPARNHHNNNSNSSSFSSWKTLDAEILALAQYVQISQPEMSLRRDWLVLLESLIRRTFSTTTSCQLQVYGSFATPSVCLFTSDIDTALWNVLPDVQSNSYHYNNSLAATVANRRDDNNSNNNNNKNEPSAIISQPAPSAPPKHIQQLERKRHKYEKWSQALSAVNVEDAAALLLDSDVKLPAVVVAEATKEEDDDDDDDDAPLFVVDRVGDESIMTMRRESSKTQQQHNVSERGDDESQASDEDSADKLHGMTLKQASGRRAHLTTESYVHQVSTTSSDDDDKQRAQEDDGDNDVEEDREEGEELEDCDSSSSSSEHDSLHVSMVAHRAQHHQYQPQQQHLHPSFTRMEAHRDELVNVLGRLANRLRKVPYARKIVLIKHARVPIVKMESNLGFEADVAIGGHNGTDTSAFAASMVDKYVSFGPVILLLKTILSQQKLDIPFHGGLGSYKLYVLLAYHMEKHLAMGGQDLPGEVFLSFLYRYGKARHQHVGSSNNNNNNNNDLSSHLVTRLYKDHPVRTKNGEADLSNVFLLDHIVDLFTECWVRLQDRWKQLQKNVSSSTKKKRKRSGDESGNTSVLAVLIDGHKLHQARLQSLRNCR
jgi:hypothetical protein